MNTTSACQILQTGLRQPRRTPGRTHGDKNPKQIPGDRLAEIGSALKNKEGGNDINLLVVQYVPIIEPMFEIHRSTLARAVWQY
jgi:hypothetical protein